MTHRVTADYTTLLHQASDTAETYFATAVSKINRTFGEGYAEGNPSLVIAFMQIAERDYANGCKLIVVQSILDEALLWREQLAEKMEQAKQ